MLPSLECNTVERRRQPLRAFGNVFALPYILEMIQLWYGIATKCGLFPNPFLPPILCGVPASILYAPHSHHLTNADQKFTDYDELCEYIFYQKYQLVMSPMISRYLI